MKFLQQINRFSERFVSLFTREWIEILFVVGRQAHNLSVSLFTREWIEIFAPYARPAAARVSLFTREWIEIFYPLPQAVL